MGYEYECSSTLFIFKNEAMENVNFLFYNIKKNAFFQIYNMVNLGISLSVGNYFVYVLNKLKI